jgi:DnaJ-class molecular chaperone
MAPGTVKCVDGEGLPFYIEDTKEIKKEFDLLSPVEAKPKCGNLYILFDVEFPKTLTAEQRSEIASIFQA